MSFKSNDSQQITLNDALFGLTDREKAGKQHRGYAANVTESVGEDTSIITDYQLDANTHSDSDFLKEHLESVERTPECNTLVTDGAYSSEANRQAC